MSINRLNEKYEDIEEIVEDKIINISDKCNICKKKYSYNFNQASKFLFVILDYMYNDLKNPKKINIKKKLIHYNISCFGKFYEIIGFILMPKCNHFTTLLMSNINDNDEYEYFFI